MKAVKIFAVVLGLLVVGSSLERAEAESKYILPFIPTHNAPPGATGIMHITLTDDGWSQVRLKVRGLYPNTVYTIWTVFNKLTWKPGDVVSDAHVESMSAIIAYPTFPPEGNGVTPTARTDRGFTDGMGLDQGATFVTDESGDGQVRVKLNYDIIDAAPVSNKDIIVQKVCSAPLNPEGTCPGTTKTIRITTTYLRQFISQYPQPQRATMCANYDPSFDPDVPGYSTGAAHGADARFWQCVDPATGVPRVHQFAFDHFRLADHPDALTHGFIGGNSADHFIDMVGRRCDLAPSVGATCP
jgi:hypothetical protein